MKEAGLSLDKSNIDEIVELRIHNVTPRFVREIRE